MAVDVEYDYDEVINYCKGEGQQNVIELVNKLKALSNDLSSCQDSFHSKNNSMVIGRIYDAFETIIGRTNNNTGLAGLDKQAANIINVCYSEAMTDKKILEGSVETGAGAGTSSSSSSGNSTTNSAPTSQTNNDNTAGMSFGPTGSAKPSDFNYKFPMSNEIAAAAKNMGFTEDQIKIAIGISRAETGNFTSDLSLNNYNYGGMRGNGGWQSFATKEQGINAFLSNLKENYFNQGLNTVSSIQPKYAPSSENDPNEWINLVNGCMS